MATKTLKTAIPIVYTGNNSVLMWNCEITMTDGDFSRDYIYAWDTHGMGKTPDMFTPEELLAAAPPSLDEVFLHHKAIHDGTYTPPTDTVGDFSLKSLRSATTEPRTTTKKTTTKKKRA